MRITDPIPRPSRGVSTRLEGLIWIVSLLFLGFWGPTLHGHLSFCIPSILGIDGCIGCGIGNAIGLALQGDVVNSWHAHALGIPALLIILYRIAQISHSIHPTHGDEHGKCLPVSAGH